MNSENTNENSTVTARSYANNMLTSFLTFSPLDRTQLPKSYTKIMKFIFFAIFTEMMFYTSQTDPRKIESMAVLLSAITFLTTIMTIFITIFFYLISWLNSFILEKEHSSKQFAICFGALFPSLFLNRALNFVFPPHLNLVARLISFFITFYYLYINYKPYYTGRRGKNKALHIFFIGLFCFSTFISLKEILELNLVFNKEAIGIN